MAGFSHQEQLFQQVLAIRNNYGRFQPLRTIMADFSYQEQLWQVLAIMAGFSHQEQLAGQPETIILALRTIMADFSH